MIDDYENRGLRMVDICNQIFQQSLDPESQGQWKCFIPNYEISMMSKFFEPKAQSLWHSSLIRVCTKSIYYRS